MTYNGNWLDCFRSKTNSDNCCGLLGIAVGARTAPHHCPKTRLAWITPDANSTPSVFQHVNNTANSIDSYPATRSLLFMKYYRDFSVSPEPCDMLYTECNMGTKLGTVVLGVCDCGLKLIEVSHKSKTWWALCIDLWKSTAEPW